VEQNLVRVFELATHWNAILLFDEADVFLESRSLKDLRRNSLVSTLLRILEYFSGILFLTSNRVKTFDEAFQSRIHLAIRYHELDESQRRSIWELWLDKADEDIEERRKFDVELEKGGDLVTVPLNGRQIRNCFRSGMALARARPVGQRKLRYEDVEKMVKRTGELLHYMMQSEAMASLKRER
jgi:SpoVK/Ycf46/Vps4 family AAA+-type ATPase